MNTLVIIASIIGFMILAALSLFFVDVLFGDDAALDLDHLAEAIAAVENWDGSSIGAAGERGKYQISFSVWSQHTNKPFALAASNQPVAVAEQLKVTLKHLEWIIACLPGLKLRRTAFNIALVYTYGYGNVAARRFSREKHDYAIRVANVYYSSP